jgi:hypothetical protein
MWVLSKCYQYNYLRPVLIGGVTNVFLSSIPIRVVWQQGKGSIDFLRQKRTRKKRFLQEMGMENASHANIAIRIRANTAIEIVHDHL